VEQAHIFIDTEIVGKMDPFIVVEVPNSTKKKKIKEYRTEIKDEAG